MCRKDQVLCQNVQLIFQTSAHSGSVSVTTNPFFPQARITVSFGPKHHPLPRFCPLWCMCRPSPGPTRNQIPEGSGRVFPLGNYIASLAHAQCNTSSCYHLAWGSQTCCQEQDASHYGQSICKARAPLPRQCRPTPCLLP